MNRLLILLLAFTNFQLLSKAGRNHQDTRHTRRKRNRRPNQRPTAAPPMTLGDGNMFADQFNVPDCEGYYDLWEDPSIPLEERNKIGRAIFQTTAKIEQAKALIKQGKVYNLGYDYTNNLPLWPGRVFEAETSCQTIACETSVITTSIGNVGTQFDGLRHHLITDTNNPNEQIWFNNIRGNYSFGSEVLGVELLPVFFTRGILLDVPAALGLDVLPDNYTIFTEDILATLAYQGMSKDDLEFGDVVMVNTGFATQYFLDENNAYYTRLPPGLDKEVVQDVFYDTGVMIIGSDNWSIEFTWGYQTRGAPLHRLWIACGGGFLHEAMKLDEWVQDARQGLVPYIGAYMFKAVPIEGAAGGIGAPQLFV